MIEQSFFVEPVSWQFDSEPLRAVRTEVFIVEQSVPEEEEWDDRDERAQHFLATTPSGEPIGAARLTRDGLIGRMAVVRSWRGAGVGDALLRAALEFAQGLGLAETRLMAQTHAIGFYERHGFTAFGDEFDDAGIPHRWMRRTTEAIERRADRPHREVPDGPTDKYREDFDDRAGLTRCLATLVQGARHELALLSRNLDPRVTDTPRLVSAVRNLCTHGAPARVRIIVMDSRQAVQACHPLIALAQRLPSLIQFRQPGKDHQDYPCAFAVADEHHVLFRPFGDQYGGYYQHGHRREARRLLEYFDEAWEQGEPDPNFRRLSL